MTRNILIAVGAFAALLLVAGVLHLAYRTSAQLYLQNRETINKQTEHIFAVENRLNEVERKLAVFEQHLRYEAQK